MQSYDLTVKRANPYELREHKDNARQGNVAELKRSLQRSGQYKPIVVNKRTGYVIAGNHTLRAIQELGWDSVAFVELDVDVATETRIMLADNRIGDEGAYDTAALIGLIESLNEDFEGTGYTDTDLEILKHLDDEIELDDEMEPEPVVHYGVVVEVRNLAEQMQLMRTFQDQGLDVRPLNK